MSQFIQGLTALIDNVSGFIWGGSWNGAQLLPVGILAVVLLGTGLYFMLRLGFRPLRRFVPALGELWAGRKAQGKDGDITPWQALSTALSGQVGTGNLAGVATAISLGGPGAIFWMWMTAILGMAAAFAESSLAVKYRETHADGRIHGGPMYYIKNGLNKGKAGFGGAFGWLAALFCIGTLVSAVATGGMIQANSITESVTQTGLELGVTVPQWGIGLVLAALVFLVIIGGIKSIGSVAGKVVPFMALFYVLCALIVLILHYDKVPGAFTTIFSYAFGFEQAVGGAAGYGVLQAIRYGVARGLFSNEAGQGSAPIAHAAAQTKSPVAQGEIAMIGVFIDTIVICTMTALVILVSTGAYPGPDGTVVEYAWQSTLNSSAITIGLRQRDTRRPMGDLDLAGAVCLHHHYRVELLRPAGRRLSLRGLDGHADPLCLGAGGVCRLPGDRHGDAVALWRYRQRLHGLPEPSGHPLPLRHRGDHGPRS